MSYYDYGYGTSTPQKSLWYYLVFPIDAWSQHEGDPEYDVFYQQKENEIFPIMRFLIPTVVLISGFALSLGFFSSLFFFGIESFLLALVCKFYAKLEDMGFVIELTFNFWISFIIQTLILTVLMFIFSIFF